MIKSEVRIVQYESCVLYRKIDLNLLSLGSLPVASDAWLYLWDWDCPVVISLNLGTYNKDVTPLEKHSSWRNSYIELTCKVAPCNPELSHQVGAFRLRPPIGGRLEAQSMHERSLIYPCSWIIALYLPRSVPTLLVLYCEIKLSDQASVVTSGWFRVLLFNAL